MQDPMNPQSTRRAGESARRSDSPDGHLSDWQRHTAWIGPVPSNPDPFDEPADSPEIGEIRSDDVRNRTGDFWKVPDDMREPSCLIADPYSVRKHADSDPDFLDLSRPPDGGGADPVFRGIPDHGDPGERQS